MERSPHARVSLPRPASRRIVNQVWWIQTEVALDSTTGRSTKASQLAELTAEHRRLDEQVQVLERRRSLTPAEQAEVSRLKKQKLLTKDRIARLT